MIIYPLRYNLLRDWVLAVGIILLSGCAGFDTHINKTELQNLPTSLELNKIPFYSQGDRQCGPASLAMVLNHSGLEVTPGQLSPMVYTPGLGGSMPQDMIGAVRRHNYVTHSVNTLEEVIRKVATGHPVIVLQKVGLPGFSNWHYAVVIGYDLAGEEMILHSGNTPRMRMSFHEFLRVWKHWGNWGVIVLKS